MLETEYMNSYYHKSCH